MILGRPRNTALTLHCIYRSGIKIRCLSISRNSRILRLPSEAVLQALVRATLNAQARNRPTLKVAFVEFPIDLSYTYFTDIKLRLEWVYA